MNTFILKIKKILKSFTDFFKINPHKHWGVLIYTFLSLTLALILLSLYFLCEIKNEKIFQVAPLAQEQKNLLKEKLLNQTTDLFGIKAQKETEISNNPAVYKDPSL